MSDTSNRIVPPASSLRSDQVLHDLVLAVNGDRASRRERREIDAARAAAEAQLDAVVHEPFAHHPRADAGRVQEVDRLLLEHACADAFLDVASAAVLDDDRVDACLREEVR